MVVTLPRSLYGIGKVHNDKMGPMRAGANSQDMVLAMVCLIGKSSSLC